MSKSPYFSPWHAEGDFTADDRLEIFDGMGFPFLEIAAFEDTWTFGEVQRLNLILAAPEVLEALKETRDAAAAILRALVVEDEETFSRIMGRVGTAYDGYGARANAAIAKAEGRTEAKA